jgi:GTP-binding protein
VIVHVLDCATLEPNRDPITDLDIIESELRQYGGLDDRPRIVALNKIDVPEARDLADMVKPMIEERGYPVFEISAVSREGLRPLSFAIAEQVKAKRVVEAAVEMPRIVISPKAVDESGFTVVKEPEGFRVRGQRPERWIRQTDFGNDEAVGYLADRLARLGVEEELMKAGAMPGSTVMIGPEENAVVFDWFPAVGAANQGPRGSDSRLEVRPEDLA